MPIRINLAGFEVISSYYLAFVCKYIIFNSLEAKIFTLNTLFIFSSYYIFKYNAFHDSDKRFNMSAQLIELLMFAGIAFILINRLISMLGTTDEDDPARRGSIFGESGNLKDVTTSSLEKAVDVKAIKNVTCNASDDIIVLENKDNIMQALYKISDLLVGFSPEKFVKGAGSVFKMIVKALIEHDQKVITELVDKRYINQIPETTERYKHLKNLNTITAKIADVLTFGNSIIIKVLFASKDKQNSFKEEWTFQKSLLNNSPDWYLTNTEAVE